MPVDIKSLPVKLAASKRVGAIMMMSFLENLEVGAAGDIVFTSMLDGRLWRLTPGGVPQVQGQVEGHAIAVAEATDGGWLVFGRRLMGGASVLFRVKPDGAVEDVMDLPEVAFPNGVQRMPNGHYLLADSARGIIWDVDYPKRRYTIWLQHELLDPGQFAMAPLGVNGIKVFNDRLYATSTGRALILSVALKDGKPVGSLDVVHEGISADDFAFDCEGTMYITTHPQDVVLRLTASGDLSLIAAAAEGMRGCTACRFGRTPGDETGLYVVTDGGLFNPMSGGLQQALVVRLETHVAGAPVDVLS